MSDVRALLAGRGIAVGDGAYHERLDPPSAPIEEMLRAWSARLGLPGAGQAGAFVRQVNALEAEIRAMNDTGLRRELRAATGQMRQQGFSDDPIARAFAVVREAARRTLGMRHHDVQLLAGRALLQGRIAEMATGEGKTLAATLASCTAAATGAAVHVVTVNDYLATRDAQDNAPLFELLGLSVGNVKEGTDPADRRLEYGRDIVYVSNKELTFDYLKDLISHGATLRAHRKLRALHGARAGAAPILRGLHVAIVDEADSVLIDEARTPLIISETLPDDLGKDVYDQAIGIARRLNVGQDFVVAKDRDVWLTEAGQDKDEAAAIAAAGQPGRITVATNMAGRGTDIKLSDEVERKGGLHVILTEFHESARVDRQLFGRCARQGDPGSAQAIVCLQDELFVRYAAHVTTLLASACLRHGRLLRLLVGYAQSSAERRNRHVRLETIKRDRNWLRALGFVGRAKK